MDGMDERVNNIVLERQAQGPLSDSSYTTWYSHYLSLSITITLSLSTFVSHTQTPQNGECQLNSATVLGPKLESLTNIDLSKLSQSELQALSLCSDSAFHLQPTHDDVVVPQINPSLFNESAGTRRQTYSRLHRRRVSSSSSAGGRPPLAGNLPSDSTNGENLLIFNHLKKLLGQNESNSKELVVYNPEPVPENNSDAIVVEDSNERKRKRGRKPKDKFLKDGNGVELLKVDQNGAVVDFAELGNADEFYNGELRRRTEGLWTEEEGLGYLRGLDGQWCSTRKKRKFVDASYFGDKFPVGWKLLLALRRRDGRVSVYCHRYVSPTGEHFLSCNEAASFLKSHFGDGEKQPMDQSTGSDQPVYEVALFTRMQQHAGFVDKDNSALPSSSISDANDNVNLLGIENLTEVQIRDIFDCSKCNKTYDEKDEYLRYLLLVHKNTTRRYGLGTSVGGGVIIKDGKYECQFCHKVFQERRSYSGHVGVHVRNIVRNFEEWPAQVSAPKANESMSHDGLQSRMSKMDALIEIAQNSIVENSNDGHIEKPSGGYSTYNLNMDEISAAVSDHGLSLSCHLTEMDNCMADAALGPELKHSSDEHMITEEEVGKIDGLSSSIANNVNVVGTSTSDHLELDAVGNYGSCEPEVICGNYNVQPNEVVPNTTKQIKDNIIQSRISDPSVAPVQSLHCVHACNAISNKGDNGVSSADQKLDDVSGFKELSLDEIEPLRNNYVNRQQLVSLPEISMELANHAELGDTPAVVEPETIMLNITARHQLTSVCVWCRNEFDHEAIDFEILSDSIGFMCPTCKDTISGKLDGVCP